MRAALLALILPVLPTFAFAQENAPPAAMTRAQALERLPDERRYTVNIIDPDMAQERAENLARMIGDAARGQHFYGAIYAYRPAAGGSTEIKMRSKMHSLEAARRGALADCEAARAAKDSSCILIGEIVPENWTSQMPQLNHLAMQALRETANELPSDVVVARSRDGDGFEIRSGDGVRTQTLDECNARQAEAALAQDCEVVIDDAAASPRP